MNEIEFSAVGTNPGIEPALHIWGWEVAAYLYLGGLVAGLMILSGFLSWRDRQGGAQLQSMQWAPVLAPVLLSLGMLGLFLDLEHKLHFYHFYTTFQPLSPMSWGSWILLLVFPVQVLFLLGSFGFRVPLKRYLPVASIALGTALGIYTGILLSTLGARPMWNTPLLGPLFLVSGLSTATALMVLFEPSEAGRRWLGALDLKLIAGELVLLLLILGALLTGGAAQRDAAQLVTGGDYTALFWVLVVIVGLITPAALELLHRAGRAQATIYVPLLVLLGGFALRAVILFAGQASGWRAI